jgi:ankyrin repeat protein
MNRDPMAVAQLIAREPEAVQTILHRSLVGKYVAIIETLLKNGAQVNHVDANGRTPLHIAVVCGSTDIVNTLLSHGASPNAQDELLMTPLHYATYQPTRHMLDTLLLAGAQSGLCDILGRTPHQTAIANNRRDYAAILTQQYLPSEPQTPTEPPKTPYWDNEQQQTERYGYDAFGFLIVSQAELEQVRASYASESTTLDIF